jgi:flagellin
MVMKITSSKSVRNELTKTKRETANNLSRLSSGSRIAKTADDAAGLSIAQKLEATARSKQVASRNATNAVSVLQVMEGGLGEMSNIAIRLRELAITAASDTISDEERSYVNLEAISNIKEMDRINQTTEFGGQKLFKGDLGSLEIQVDSNTDQSGRIKINLKDMIHSSHALGITDVKMDSKLRAQLSLAKVDNAIKELSTSLAKVGSYSKRLSISGNKLAGDIINTSSAKSRIKDVDYASEVANKVSNDIKSNAQVSVLGQTNYQNRSILKLLE